MKVLFFLTAALGLGTQVAECHPSMGQQLEDVKDIARRGRGGESTELLGNLKTLKQHELSRVGKDIKKIITGRGNPESNERYRGVPRLDMPRCRKDTCCVWKYIADEMEAVFKGPSGRCNSFARQAVRLGFHDAGAWNKTLGYGGADGSIILTTERDVGPNRSMAPVIQQIEAWYKKYHDDLGFQHITYADLIQMASSVATVVCPLGPRMKTYVGRPDSDRFAPPLELLPSPFASAPDLIEMFLQKTISPHGLVALVGAHTTSQQNFVDPSKPNAPQDSTPGVWDVLFYKQTLRSKVPERIVKFPSDEKLAVFSETKDEWKAFASRGGQRHWNEDYAREYIRLSILGVEDVNGLTDCTKVLPPFISRFRSRDQKKIDKWLSTDKKGGKYDKIAEDLNEGKEVSDEEVKTIAEGEVYPAEKQDEEPKPAEVVTEAEADPANASGDDSIVV